MLSAFRAAGMAVAMSGCLVAVPQSASPFGSVNLLDQQSEHEKITRIALKPFGLGPRTMNEIAGEKGLLGAVGAPDRPDRGLMATAEVHCDGGDHLAVPGYPQGPEKAARVLMDCRSFIISHLAKAVRVAADIATPQGRVRTRHIPSSVPCTYAGTSGRAKCDVLEALGLAFHAAQDFYSHSNWNDIAAPGPASADNPPGLGNDGRSPFLDPRLRSGPVAGLISGCFQGKPERGLCFYGDRKDRIRHRMLNKDTGAIRVSSGAIGSGTTERGAINDNFRRAVSAAIDDTRDKWAWFEASVLAKYGRVQGGAIICAMRNDNEYAC